MANKRINKRIKTPGSDRTAFRVVLLLLLLASVAAFKLWSCLYNVSPEFNYILLSKDNDLLKVLNGESLRLHPKNRVRFRDISTNICFNQGVRLFARGIDINALFYDEIPISDLLPNGDIYKHYSFRVEFKRYNQDMGYVDILVEPFVEDWLEKAERSIGGERKIAVLEQALKLMPDDKRIKEKMIEAYISLGRWDPAVTMLEDMAKEGPDEDILYSLLEVYKAKSSSDGVISTLRKLLELNHDDYDIRYQLAQYLEEAGRSKDAVKEYEELLNIMAKEDHLPVYRALGFLYTETKQFEKAISAYLNALEMDTSDENIYYNLSSLYEKTGKKDKADQFLAKALQLKAGDTEGRLRLSESLLEKGNLSEAEAYIKEVLKTSPKSIEAWALMSRVAEKKKDTKALKTAYENILALDSKNNTVIYNLGIMEYEAGNLAKAQSYLEKYVKAYSKDTDARAFLFDIYRKLKKEDLAFKEAISVVQLKPKEIDYYHYIFEYLNTKGNFKEMIDVMKTGIKNNPKDKDLKKYLAFAYLKTGEDDLAVTQLNEILKLSPDDISILLQLARLQEKLGKLEDALATYKKIMDISPGHEEAGEAYLRLRLEILPGE